MTCVNCLLKKASRWKKLPETSRLSRRRPTYKCGGRFRVGWTETDVRKNIAQSATGLWLPPAIARPQLFSLLQFLGAQEADVFVGFGGVVQLP